MKLDIFTEIQRQQCDAQGGFQALLKDSLAQARAADKAGFTCWWQVEHHCTPEFSYSSCPEMILQEVARATKHLRVGHAGVLAPFEINHPLRAAERAAFLDNVSAGRLELGLAKSGGKEWETFGVSEEQAAEDLVEATRLIPKAWTEENFSWCSERWQVKDRNVLPKPVQSPHPPLWHTCSSPPSFIRAGELGVGVLATTLFAPLQQLSEMMTGYREAARTCEQPAGTQVNNQVGVFTFVHVAKSDKAAIASGAPKAALWYVSSAPRVFNVPRDIFYSAIRGTTDPRSHGSIAALGAQEQPSADDLDDPNPVVALLKREFAGEDISNEEIFEVIRELDSVVIGGVETCRKKMEGFRDIGVDRLMCLMQMGAVPQKLIVESIKRTGAELLGDLV
jgi:alkanesulfonate monooxygenase SsuD/methylene tetrahydromethanopterin reductase-like flavin-dependent oxidoreductase (luciferase family)